MPVKMRPPSLAVTPAPSTTGGVSVTDTMTLVVKDYNGREMRVKDSFQQTGSSSSALSRGGAGSGPDDAIFGACTPAGAKGSSEAEGSGGAKSSATGNGEGGGDESRSVLDRIGFEQLRVGVVIGQGSGGKVRAAQHRETKKTYALKYVDFEGKSEDAREMIANELRRVEALKHENIVSSFEAFFRKSRLCVVLEWMDAGSMSDVIKRHNVIPLSTSYYGTVIARGLGGGGEGAQANCCGFPEPMVAYVAKGLFSGLAHLHKEKTIHRDIKPANVLANSKGEVKVSDFGISKEFVGSIGGGANSFVAAGSTPYMSCEMITNQPYGFETDVWSAGMTIAECAIGAYPFVKKKAADPFEMLEYVQNGAASIVWNQRDDGRVFSKELVALVEACLAPRAQRPSAATLLNHPFIQLADQIKKEDAGKWFMEGATKSSSSSASNVAAASGDGDA